MFGRNPFAAPIALVALCFSLGCLSPRSYVDPVLGEVDPSQFKKGTTPAINLVVQFKVNDEFRPKVNLSLLPLLKQHILATGVVKEVREDERPDLPFLRITVNNIANIADAREKGARAGFSFGQAGSIVTDKYVFTAILEKPNKTIIKKEYMHAIHTTIGNTPGPKGLTPWPTSAEAFNKATEELIQRLMLDLQNENQL